MSHDPHATTPGADTPTITLNYDRYRLTDTPLGKQFQHRETSPGAEWRTVRPLKHAGVVFVLLGAIDAPTWHLFEDALAHLSAHEYDEAPMPSVDPPLAFLDISPDGQRYLAARAMGYDSDALRDLVPPDTLPEVLLREFSAFAVVSRLETTVLIAQQLDALRALREDSFRASPAWDAPEVPRTRIVRAEPSVVPELPVPPGRLHSDIVALTPEQLAAVSERFQSRDAAAPLPRIRWPFARMAVGAMVTITGEHVTRAQRAAHAHASHTGKLFRTARTPSGALQVYRLR